ncbi:MAG: hypothetical protein RBT65_16145 [Methanolobus sp.]|nr:hypothetical protein [Methanolobus sp.]
MKYLSKVKCQARNDEGKIVTFSAGQVYDFKKPPSLDNWTPLKEVEKDVDFRTATLEILTATEWDYEELIQFAKDEYDVDLSHIKAKSTLVRAFIDARYRAVDVKGLKTSPNQIDEGTK